MVKILQAIKCIGAFLLLLLHLKKSHRGTAHKEQAAHREQWCNSSRIASLSLNQSESKIWDQHIPLVFFLYSNLNRVMLLNVPVIENSGSYKGAIQEPSWSINTYDLCVQQQIWDWWGLDFFTVNRELHSSRAPKIPTRQPGLISIWRTRISLFNAHFSSSIKITSDTLSYFATSCICK